MSPVLVVHVAETARFGVATYLNALFSEQSEDAQHILLCPDTDAALIDDHNLLRKSTFRRTGRNLRSLFALLAALRRIDLDTSPAIFHAHSSLAGVVVRLYAALTGSKARVLYSPHGWAFQQDPGSFKGRVIGIIERMLSVATDRIVAISRFERDLGLRVGISPSKLCHIYNGLPDAALPEATISRHTSVLKILFVGRLDFLKGVDLLLRVASRMKGRISIQIVGSSFLKDYNVSDVPANVQLLGARSPSEIHSLMLNADIVAVPSRWEGFGLVALEAMRAQKPVLAAEVGGLPELVKPGETGLLFEAGSVDALELAIEKAMTLDLVRLGIAGRRRYEEQFGARAMISATTQLYKSLI